MDAVVNVFETLQKANLYLIDLKKKNDTASRPYELHISVCCCANTTKYIMAIVVCCCSFELHSSMFRS